MWKIELNPGQQLFFTSDTHYNHANICRGVTKWTGDIEKYTRPFTTLEQMNYVIVDEINFVVKEDDILIHLGDWSLGGFDSIREFRKKIHCKNIYLVLGNHDYHIEANKDNIRELFIDVAHYTKLELTKGLDTHKFVLCHYPICSWEGMNKGVMHLFGHVHLPPERKIMKGKSMDVGVDGNYMAPQNAHFIVNLLGNRPNATNVIASDHHEVEIR